MVDFLYINKLENLLQMEFENVCRDNIKCLQSLVEANCSMSEKSIKQINGKYDLQDNYQTLESLLNVTAVQM